MGKAGYRKSYRLDGYGFMSPDDKPRLTHKPSNRAEKRKLRRAVRHGKFKEPT